jgi:hypothetical protein
MATGKKTGGRKVGTPNKITTTVRQSVLDTFVAIQSDRDANLLAWAKANPTEFYRIAARIVPNGTRMNVGELSGSLAEQGRKVIEGLAAGTLGAEDASVLMSALASQSRIVEVSELEQRVAMLESAPKRGG